MNYKNSFRTTINRCYWFKKNWWTLF